MNVAQFEQTKKSLKIHVKDAQRELLKHIPKEFRNLDIFHEYNIFVYGYTIPMLYH